MFLEHQCGRNIAQMFAPGLLSHANHIIFRDSDVLLYHPVNLMNNNVVVRVVVTSLV